MAESAKKILANAGDLVKQAQELQELEEQNRTKANSEVSSTIDALPTLSKDTNAIPSPSPLSGTNISSEPANTLVTEAIPVAAAPAKSQDIIAAEKAVTVATDALAALEVKIPDPNATPEAAAAAITEIETAKATLKAATDKLTELNAAAAATAAAAAPIGGRRHSKRRHPKKGSRKSKKGGRSRKSKKGGRSRKNGSKHRKHSRAHKKH